MRPFFGLAIALVACTSSISSTSKAPAPTLEVDTPTRGTTVNGSSVTVTGKASGDGITVTVDGNAVAVGDDGSFSTMITVASGISVIETDATDSAGTKLTDTRAVLAGTLATSDGSVAAPIGAYASAAALTMIGNAVASDAKSIDFTDLAKAVNPVYNDSGCPGVVVNITSVSIGNIDVGLTPSSSGLAAAVTLDNVTVKLSAAFQAGVVFCVDGSDTVTVSASAIHVNGDLGLDVSSGKLATTLTNPSVTMDGFNLSVGDVPSAIVDLFQSAAQSKVQSALSSAIESKVPGLANARLASLLAQPVSEDVLGVETQLDVTPTAATISASGLFVSANVKVTVSGGSGGTFVDDAMPITMSLLSSSHDLGVAIANDLANQLFAGLWAAGAFDKTVPVSTISLLAALLDPNATQLQVSLSLPPTVSSDANGDLQLAIGDALILVEDSAGNELQQIALSLTTAMAATPASSGALALTLATPTVYAQVLGQVNDGSRQLTGTQVQGIVTGVWGIVSQQASGALAKLPMPSVGGMQLGTPTVSAKPGFIVADVPLQ
jgi:hypothetical protein